MFFTAALGYVRNVLNSYSILYSSRTVLLICLISGWFSYIIFPKLYQANYTRPFIGLSGALIPKNGKKQCVSEVDFNELKQQTCYWETLHWYYIGGVTLWELLHPVFRVWRMLILVIIKLQNCVWVIQVSKENQFFETDFLWPHFKLFALLIEKHL